MNIKKFFFVGVLTILISTNSYACTEAHLFSITQEDQKTTLVYGTREYFHLGFFAGIHKVYDKLSKIQDTKGIFTLVVLTKYITKEMQTLLDNGLSFNSIKNKKILDFSNKKFRDVYKKELIKMSQNIEFSSKTKDALNILIKTLELKKSLTYNQINAVIDILSDALKKNNKIDGIVTKVVMIADGPKEYKTTYRISLKYLSEKDHEEEDLEITPFADEFNRLAKSTYSSKCSSNKLIGSVHKAIR